MLAAAAASSSLANDRDLACLAIYANAAGSSDAPASGVIAATLYYVGRIEGRSPGFDFEKGLIALITAPEWNEATVRGHAERCAAETMAKGQELQDLGGRLQQFGSQ